MANPLQPPEHPDVKTVSEVYGVMYLIRRVEERIADVYPTDRVKSPIHLSIGQEPPSVGVCRALRPKDVVFGTYRGHALYLAKGGDLKGMIAELFGKVTGVARGKAGSMHLVDQTVGMMGTSAIVSTTIPQAVGYALAEKMRGKDTMVCVFFGDGATEEGVFWESLNFAALHKLPLLFVCENNQYAIHTPLLKRIPEPNFCERVSSFGVPSVRITGNNVFDIWMAASRLTEEARDGGPRFLEVETYRWREHVGPGYDWHLGYRSESEGAEWMSRDERQLQNIASSGLLFSRRDREICTYPSGITNLDPELRYPDLRVIATDFFLENPLVDACCIGLSLKDERQPAQSGRRKYKDLTFFRTTDRAQVYLPITNPSAMKGILGRDLVDYVFIRLQNPSSKITLFTYVLILLKKFRLFRKLFIELAIRRGRFRVIPEVGVVIKKECEL